jgi:hypothetical protein
MNVLTATCLWVQVTCASHPPSVRANSLPPKDEVPHRRMAPGRDGARSTYDNCDTDGRPPARVPGVGYRPTSQEPMRVVSCLSGAMCPNPRRPSSQRSTRAGKILVSEQRPVLDATVRFHGISLAPTDSFHANRSALTSSASGLPVYRHRMIICGASAGGGSMLHHVVAIGAGRPECRNAGVRAHTPLHGTVVPGAPCHSRTAPDRSRVGGRRTGLRCPAVCSVTGWAWRRRAAGHGPRCGSCSAPSPRIRTRKLV